MPAVTTAEQATIRQYCKALRTPTIGFQFQTLADQAIREKHTYTRYLEALLAMEVENGNVIPWLAGFKRLVCLDSKPSRILIFRNPRCRRHAFVSWPMAAISAVRSR